MSNEAQQAGEEAEMMQRRLNQLFSLISRGCCSSADDCGLLEPLEPLKRTNKSRIHNVPTSEAWSQRHIRHAFATELDQKEGEETPNKKSRYVNTNRNETGCVGLDHFFVCFECVASREADMVVWKGGQKYREPFIAGWERVVNLCGECGLQE